MNLIPNFIHRFFQKKDLAEKYEIHYLNAKPMSKEQKELIKSCRRILIDNKVSLNKIRFVLEPSFTYDIDNNKINPTYKQLIPKNKKLGVIEIGIPRNIMQIFVGEYHTDDNFAVLRELVMKTKHGIVVWVNKIDYNDMIGIVNLDNAINYYKTQYDDSD